MMQTGFTTDPWQHGPLKKPKPSAPAEPKSTRTYSPDEVVEQFKFRLGGLDSVKIFPSSHDFGMMQMSIRVGKHVVEAIFSTGSHSAVDVAGLCDFIFTKLRLALQLQDRPSSA